MSTVCPFASAADDEDVVSRRIFDTEAMEYRKHIGHYRRLGVGRRAREDELLKSSSGGLTSWLVEELLDRRLVDSVIHLGNAEDKGSLFEFCDSTSASEVASAKKSKYYAASMDKALEAVENSEVTKVALVGVPCNIRAARLLASQGHPGALKIEFFIALVCGHMKNRYFAEALAWQTGILPKDLSTVDFRVKNPSRSAADYDFSASARDGTSTRARSRDLLGTNWGHAAFQPDACNYCDDVYGETADVTFGDAWIPGYSDDWRGYNLAVVRDSTVGTLLDEAIERGDVTFASASPAAILKAQGGALRHRVEGLSLRLQDDIDAGLPVPPKRTAPGSVRLGRRRRRIVRLRRQISKSSTEYFVQALQSGNIDDFLKPMGELARRYKSIDQPVHRRLVLAAKRLARRCLRRP